MRNKKLNALSMKHYNRYNALSHIRKEKLTRADLARKTGLTRASITYIIDDLISENLIIQDEPIYTKKKRISLHINKDYCYTLGIGINRDNITISVLDFSSNLVEYVKFHPKKNQDINFLLSKIDYYLSIYMNKYQNKVLGIGITAPGPVNTKTGVIYNPPNLDNWHNFNVSHYFSKKYNLSCFLEKDINGIALVENSLGIGKKTKNFVEIVADHGVGASIIVDGSLYRGMGFSGELGHVSINYLNGRPCPCGNKGCVEMYATIPSILHYSKEQGYNFKNWKHIVNNALRNNPDALQVMHKEADYLAGALISCLNIMNVYTIGLTGLIAYKGELFAKILRNKIENHTLSTLGNLIVIVPTAIKEIDIIAPGNIVLERFFSGEFTKEINQPSLESTKKQIVSVR